MLGALIIVFREVIEAGIIVGIVLAVTRGVARSRLWISVGLAGGVIGAGLVAAFAGAIADALQGVGQELFNGSILAIAVVMLTWHNVWMASHGRQMAAEMRQIGEEVKSGARSLFALAVVVGVAVMREGSEIALFLYGLAAAGGSSAAGLLLGSALGLVAGCAVSALTFLGLVTIPQRYLFQVTTILITFLAAGLAAQSVLFFQQAGLVTALSQTAWDTSGVLSDTSLFGRVLHTLVGYSDQPSVMQVVVYAATLAVIFTLSKVFAAPNGARRGLAARPAANGAHPA
ncbi:MAG TPA: FTR1 family protein [Roseiarcus sp.]|jgi:high-affinity iron transporter|nr:FTR1 family protein [Roseiarcus sp.]